MKLLVLSIVKSYRNSLKLYDVKSSTIIMKYIPVCMFRRDNKLITYLICKYVKLISNFSICMRCGTFDTLSRLIISFYRQENSVSYELCGFAILLDPETQI